MNAEITVVSTRAFLAALSALDRAPVQAAVVRVLAERPNQLVLRDELILGVYGRAEPEWSEGVIRVAIFMLRRRGFRITTNHRGGPNLAYRLEVRAA